MSERSVLQADSNVIFPVGAPELLPYESELAAISRLLQFGSGQFSLSFAVCNSPTLRDKLIRASVVGTAEIESIVVPSGTVDVFAAVRELYHGTEVGLFISGVESSISDSKTDDRTISSLNASRDLWPDTFRCPVVFWLPAYAATVLSLHALDFWRVRSHRFHFVSDSVPLAMRQPDTWEGRQIAALSLPDDEKLARIEELRQRLIAIGTPSNEMRPHALRWWDELATMCQIRGDLDEALRIRREEELPVFERLGDVRSTAVTKGKIADVLWARGNLDEALRILQDELLPVFERLGDVRSTAVTKGNIADVLKARGDLAKALRIFQDELLPVFEKLGDVKNTAVTKGKIADVLQARGDLDEAIRIRRDEELPVYLKLDARLDVLACKNNLAILFLQRNQGADRRRAKDLLKEALRAATEMKLPDAEQIRNLMRVAGL